MGYGVFGFQPEEIFLPMQDLGLALGRAGDDEHDFAFRRMCFVVCKQFGSSAATELLKFLCQLTRYA